MTQLCLYGPLSSLVCDLLVLFVPLCLCVCDAALLYMCSRWVSFRGNGKWKKRVPASVKRAQTCEEQFKCCACMTLLR